MVKLPTSKHTNSKQKEEYRISVTSFLTELCDDSNNNYDYWANRVDMLCILDYICVVAAKFVNTYFSIIWLLCPD